VIPAFDEALKLGEVRAANIVLLGAASTILPFEPESWRKPVKATVKAKALDVN